MMAEATSAGASDVDTELLGPPRLLRGAYEYRLAQRFAVTMRGFGYAEDGLALNFSWFLTPIGGSIHVIARPHQAFRPVSFLRTGKGALGWRCDELRIGNRLAFDVPVMFDDVFAIQRSGPRFSFETVEAAMDVSLRATNVDAGGDAGRTWFLLLDDALWWFRVGHPPTLVGRELASGGMSIDAAMLDGQPVGDSSMSARMVATPSEHRLVQMRQRVDGSFYAIDERSDLLIFDTTGRPRLVLGGMS